MRLYKPIEKRKGNPSRVAFLFVFLHPKTKDMTIKEIQDSIVEDFMMFDDWMDRYAMLIEMG